MRRSTSVRADGLAKKIQLGEVLDARRLADLLRDLEAAAALEILDVPLGVGQPGVALEVLIEPRGESKMLRADRRRDTARDSEGNQEKAERGPLRQCFPT